jgi:hypothetical protein
MDAAPPARTGYWGHLRVRRSVRPLQLFLRAFVPFVLVLVIAGALSLQWRVQTLDRELDQTNTAFVQLAGERLERELAVPLEDLRLLARDARTLPLSSESFSTHLQNLALARRTYKRVRWIDALGREQARVDSTARDVTIAPATELADWSRSNLFAKVQALRDNELYVSGFELDTDHGKIVEPLEPLMRVAMPFVGTNGQRNGFLEIDVDMRAPLASLSIANPHGFVELLTSDGYWIKAFDPRLEWGAILREREGALFSTKNARAWGAMLRDREGHVRSDNGTFWFRTVSPPHPALDTPTWKLVLHVPQETLRKRNLGVAAALVALALAAALITAPVYWWLARKAVTPT